MVTVAGLNENSRQGFEVKKQPLIQLEAWLSRNSHWGCGHIYDETPVDIAVYVRNDPVNLIDPDGEFHKWVSHLGEWIAKSFSGNDVEPEDRSDWLRPLEPSKSKQKTKRCSDVAVLDDENSDRGALARLIFIEATGSAVFERDYSSAENPSGLSLSDAYMQERYAIAAIIYNRVAFLSVPSNPTLGFASHGASIADVVYSRGASVTQFAGFTPSGISSLKQRRIEKALNSFVGSQVCNDLLAAIYAANSYDSSKDPFGLGQTFGMRTAGHGAPGGSYVELGTIPGSGNVFYGLIP